MNTPQKHDFITFNIEYIDMKRLLNFVSVLLKCPHNSKHYPVDFDFRLLEGEVGGGIWDARKGWEVVCLEQCSVSQGRECRRGPTLGKPTARQES